MSTPEQWMVDAAKAIMAMNYPPGDAVTNIAEVIARHHQSAPAQAAGGEGAAKVVLAMEKEARDARMALAAQSTRVRALEEALRGADLALRMVPARSREDSLMRLLNSEYIKPALDNIDAALTAAPDAEEGKGGS